MGSLADAQVLVIFFFFFFPPREKPCHCNYFLKIRFKICVFVEWQEEMRETGKLLTSA